MNRDSRFVICCLMVGLDVLLAFLSFALTGYLPLAKLFVMSGFAFAIGALINYDPSKKC